MNETVKCSGSPPKLSGRSRVYFHIGTPVAQFRAPELFNAELWRRGRDAYLIPLDVSPDRLQSAIAALSVASNVGGLLVTMPLKTLIPPLCDSLDEDAAWLGSVNAVRFPGNGVIEGGMFDGCGLVAACRNADIDPAGARVLVVGCGGAGSAIAAAFAAADAHEVVLHNRTTARAHDLRERLQLRFPTVECRVAAPNLDDADIVVNATRLGIDAPDDLPFDLHRAHRELVVIDIVNTSGGTRLLAEAQARGLRTLDGTAHLQGQMNALFAYWGLT